MVSHIRENNSSGDTSGNNQAPEGEQRILFNHSLDHQFLRNLLKEALNPLPLCAVPTSIHIHSIVVTKTAEGRVCLDCEVEFECSP